MTPTNAGDIRYLPLSSSVEYLPKITANFFIVRGYDLPLLTLLLTCIEQVNAYQA